MNEKIEKMESYSEYDLEEKLELVLFNNGGIPFIQGPPGMGKTAIVEAFAKKHNLQFFPKILGRLDSTEVIGTPDKQTYNNTTITTYAYPYYLVKANEAPSLILYDEFNRCELDVRNAALQILNEHRIDEFILNDNVYIVTAGNLGEDDGTEVNELDAALNNRLVHIKFYQTMKGWCTQFANENVNKFIISFLNANPSFFYKFDQNSAAYPTPRTYTFLSNIIGKSTTNIKEILHKIKVIGTETIGAPAIQRFISYLKEIEQITIDDILNKYDEAKEILSKLDRNKISELLHELKNIDVNEIKEDQINNIIEFLKIIDQDEAVSYLYHIIEYFSDPTSFHKYKNIITILDAFPKYKEKIIGE